jgi:hypothetical protein
MDLDDDGIDAVTVWVAKARRSDGETIVTAWSYQDKARSWCAHELEAEEILWEETNCWPWKAGCRVRFRLEDGDHSAR